MGNNCFNSFISKPHIEAVKEEIQYTELDTTTGTNTGEEYIQHIKINSTASINTGPEIVQHIEPDRIQSQQGNTLAHELMFRGQAVNGTREQNPMNNINNARINRVQDIVQKKSCIKLILTMNGVKVKAVLDTGSPISIMSTRDVQRIKPQLYRSINKTRDTPISTEMK